MRLELITPQARGTLDIGGSGAIRVDPDLLGTLRVLPGVSRVRLALARPGAGN